LLGVFCALVAAAVAVLRGRAPLARPWLAGFGVAFAGLVALVRAPALGAAAFGFALGRCAVVPAALVARVGPAAVRGFTLPWLAPHRALDRGFPAPSALAPRIRLSGGRQRQRAGRGGRGVRRAAAGIRTRSPVAELARPRCGWSRRGRRLRHRPGHPLGRRGPL